MLDRPDGLCYNVVRKRKEKEIQKMLKVHVFFNDAYGEWSDNGYEFFESEEAFEQWVEEMEEYLTEEEWYEFEFEEN